MELFRQIFLAGLGALGQAQQTLKATVDKLVERGEITQQQGKQVIEEWLSRERGDQGETMTKVGEELSKVMNRLRIVGREEFETLVERVEELERRTEG